MKKLILAALAAFVCVSPAFAQQIASGSLTATGDSVTAFIPTNTPAVAIQVSGTWTGTITFQGSADGVTFITLLGSNATSGATASTTTANGVFGFGNSGFAVVRAYGTSVASGTALITVVRGGGGGGGGAGASGSVTQGTSPWIVAGNGTYGTVGSTPVTTQTCDSDSCMSIIAGSVAVTGSVGQSGNWSSRTQDGSGNNITSAAAGSTRPLDIAVVQPDGTRLTLANDPCGSTSKTTAVINNSAASGNFEIVALSGSTVVYICSVDFTAEATVDFRLVYGTGSACASGETGLTGLYAFSTTTGFLGMNKGSGGYYVYKGAAGNAICGETSGAVQINGSITYVQQ